MQSPDLFNERLRRLPVVPELAQSPVFSHQSHLLQVAASFSSSRLAEGGLLAEEFPECLQSMRAKSRRIVILLAPRLVGGLVRDRCLLHFGGYFSKARFAPQAQQAVAFFSSGSASRGILGIKLVKLFSGKKSFRPRAFSL